MAWIYLAESEDSQKPWKATSDQSPIVKMIDMPKAFCSVVCLQENCQSHPFGMTYVLSAEKCCGPMWTLFTAGSLAKTLAMQDAEKAWKASEADYFSRSFDSLARYDHDSYSWKTYQRSLIEDWEPLPQNLPNCGMTVDGEFYPLEMWVRTIEETDGGLWPTPVASEGGEGKNPTKRGRKLHKLVERFPTPDTQNHRDGTKVRKSLKGRHGLSLHHAIAKWPTPRANDSQKRGEFDIMNQRNGLPAAAKRWPTPKANETMNWNMGGNLTLTGAAKNLFPTPRVFMHKDSHLNRGKGNLGEVIGGQLNPTWVEWLMGYPCEWTVLQDWAMQWFRNVQEKRLKD